MSAAGLVLITAATISAYVLPAHYRPSVPLFWLARRLWYTDAWVGDPVLDITRSYHHRVNLLPSVSLALNDLEATGGTMPDWYGDPVVVGPSPFDYSLPPEWHVDTRWLIVVPSNIRKRDLPELSRVRAGQPAGVPLSSFHLS